MKTKETILEMRNRLSEEPNSYNPNLHVKHEVPGYKNLLLEQKKVSKLLFGMFAISSLIGIGVGVGMSVRYKAELKALQRDQGIAFTMLETYAANEEILLNQNASLSAQLNKRTSIGKVSYYSKDGCLGCSPNMKMANGEIFDETKYTLAHNTIPLNTIVIVKNLTNGKQMTARVTDRGGFNRYNRVADLSKALYDDIGAVTDKSIIEITW